MKKIFLMLALCCAVVTASAQIATENSNAFDNVGVGVTAGVSTPLDFNSIFPLNTNVGIKITKDITPVIGLQFEGIAVLNDNHFADFSTAVKATNIGFNGVLNMSNMLFGYNGTPRNFEVGLVGGLGWFHTCDVPTNSLTAKTGFDLAFNIGKNKAHSFVVTPALYWNLHKFHSIHFDKRGSQLAINLSYIYHFKTSNGTHHFKTYDVGAMLNEITRLNGALAECESRAPQTVEVEKLVEKTIVTSNCGTQWVVWFEKASDTLSPEAKAELDQIGQDMIVDVTATASPDGTEEFNKSLSERRAINVANYLIDRGLRVNSAVGKGVDYERGRSAVVKPIR